ncbi:MAG: hypothetical protein IPG68_16320 [Micrococcales bacterium]|nr:hypothetical protein [Micrococcales bacterium]
MSSWAISMAWPTTGGGSPAMVPAQRSLRDGDDRRGAGTYVAGAELLIALNDVPAVIGVLQTLGLLLVSLVMLRGSSPAPGMVRRRHRREWDRVSS